MGGWGVSGISMFMSKQLMTSWILRKSYHSIICSQYPENNTVKISAKQDSVATSLSVQVSSGRRLLLMQHSHQGHLKKNTIVLLPYGRWENLSHQRMFIWLTDWFRHTSVDPHLASPSCAGVVWAGETRSRREVTDAAQTTGLSEVSWKGIVHLSIYHFQLDCIKMEVLKYNIFTFMIGYLCFCYCYILYTPLML